MNNSIYEVSVIMATYNPIWEKCAFTLDSVVGQKDVELELIIVDDGSADNMFGRFAEYLDNKDFHNYRLIEHEENHGTVRNYYDGVSAAKGNYIKLISPGDALFNESILADWIDALEKSGRSWSFADAVYYTSSGNGVEISGTPVAPRVIDCYLKANEQECRWNYIVLEDLPLGAAILCDRSVFGEYLSLLKDKVVYSEDLSFMLMMYDAILPLYYSKACIFYEFGSGVSTSNNDKWRQRFLADMRAAEQIMINKESNDPFQIKVSDALSKINSGGHNKKRILKNLQKGGIRKVLKYRFDPRMSSMDISGCGKWWCDLKNRY